MSLRAALVRLALGAPAPALGAMGCLPAIGDPCQSSLDCSQRGERLCDTSQLGGYCTVFNCEPDKCPDSAACVAFNHVIDPACDAKDDGAWPRFERTFCVKPCNEDGDCRQGYACVAVAEEGGLVIDKENPRDKVCLVAVSLPPGDASSSVPGVCDPGEPGPLPDPYEPPVTGAGGSGGVGGGAGGSGGVGGAGGG